MLSFDIKRKINTLRDILIGKVPDPKAQVEQITIALIYKFMDDMDLSGLEFGGERVFFAGDYQKYAFSQIMLSENSAQERLNLYAEGIDKMTNNPELPQLFRDILRNTYIPYRDPETLNRFLKEIADFSYDDSEDLGNAFEYLLSIMGSQGDAGQFRTPRHIIDMMVEIIEPQKNESILDPACGTAGFLISAYNYIKNHNVDEHGNSTLTADDRNRINANFAGYDISPDMVRLSRVNMYLHRFSNPNISEYDTLTSLDKWEDKYDVIFANPPFMTPKGGIVPHSRYQVSAKRAEVLFVDYIAEHLLENGRAAVIVPEGIVFQSQTAYKQLRDMLIKEYLYAVISLPAGVFNPYSGVKTSILIMDKSRAKKQDSILFVKLNNDGYDLGAQRREIKGSEIPDVLNIFRDYKADKDVSDRPNVVVAKEEDIKKRDYILVGERYRKEERIFTKWAMKKISEICEVVSGVGFPNELQGEENGKIPFYKVSDMNTPGNEQVMTKSNNYVSEEVISNQRWKVISKNTVIFPKIGAAIGTNKKRMLSENSLFDNNIMGLVCSENIKIKFLYYMLGRIELKQWASESNPPSIRKTTVEEFKIPLPPLTVQQEIVDEIESYQRIIDGARQVVDNYKPTIKVDHSWETACLGEICEIQAGGTPARDIESFWDKNDYAWYTSGELNDIYTADPIKYISEDGYRNSSARLFPKGSLLIGMYDTAAFKMSILDRDATFNQAVCGVKPCEKLNMLFLLLYFAGNRESYLKMRVGARQRNLTKQFISELRIPIPTIEVQKDIIKNVKEEMSIVEQNKRLIEIFQQKIADKIAEVWGE